MKPTSDSGLSDLRYKIAFSSLKGFNRLNAEKMITLFGDEETFFSLPEEVLSARIGKRLGVFSEKYRKEALIKADAEVDFVRRNAINTLYFTDSQYPSRLTMCDDAPVILYTLGKILPEDSVYIAIVGTRHATSYGVDCVNHIIEDLAKEIPSPVIVSGLAYGIDAAAHRAALRNNVPTVAVLAHGLNTIYPASHRQLAADIVKSGGMLMTDYPSYSVIHKGNFLARNRIIAGLCDCTIIVESAKKGGALVTGRIAGDYGREVFAVPGRTSDPYSAGCLEMIASNKAALLTDANALIEACGWQRKPSGEAVQKQLFNEPTPREKEILNHIITCPDSTVGDMSVRLNIPVATLMALLIDMEFRDLIISVPGGRYEIANS